MESVERLRKRWHDSGFNQGYADFEAGKDPCPNENTTYGAGYREGYAAAKDAAIRRLDRNRPEVFR